MIQPNHEFIDFSIGYSQTQLAHYIDIMERKDYGLVLLHEGQLPNP